MFVDGQSVSQDEVDVFQANNLNLSSSYDVAVTKRNETTNAPTKWKISRGEREYFVELKSGETKSVLAVTGAGGVFDLLRCLSA